MSWMASLDQKLSTLWLRLVGRGDLTIEDSSATSILISPMFLVGFQIDYRCPYISMLVMVTSFYEEIDFEL